MITDELNPTENILEYSVAISKLQTLHSDWETEIAETHRRRKLRKVQVSVKDMRARQELKPDETMIPVRFINANIAREQPPYVQFLMQSRRSAIFKSPVVNDIGKTLIENEFTSLMRYPSWITSYFKCLDGAQLHGWDFVEVVYDPVKPGRVAVEHVGHEKLIFPRDTINIQQCEIVSRTYWASVSQLRAFVNSKGFSKEAVENLLSSAACEGITGKHSLRKIHKCYIRKDDVIFIAWYALAAKDSWLKEPEPFTLGVLNDQGEQLVETSFPYVPLYYMENEESPIIEHIGRGFLDEHKQEASTALWSSYINSAMRAANVMASPKNPSDSAGAAPKQTSFIVTNGGIYDSPLEFFHMPYPDPLMLSATQHLETQNAVETNQPAWAVNNRQDSRKTATEIQAATQQGQLINSVQLTNFSTFLSDVFRKAWRIIRSQILSGSIKTLCDPALAAPDYQLDAAGDIDVIQRQEKLRMRGQMWPIIQGTPLAESFLVDMIQESFPEDAARYKELLDKGDVKKQMIQTLASTIQGLVTDENGQLNPEFKEFAPQLEKISQEVQTILQPNGA